LVLEKNGTPRFQNQRSHRKPVCAGIVNPPTQRQFPAKASHHNRYRGKKTCGIVETKMSVAMLHREIHERTGDRRIVATKDEMEAET
jgi:hypothetical protein